MTDILSEIIAHKRIEIELQKQAVSLERLQEEVTAMMQKDATAGTSVAIPVRSMKQALLPPRESLPNSNAVLLRKDGYTRLPVPKKYPLHTKQPVLPQSLSLRTKNSLAVRCRIYAWHAH